MSEERFSILYVDDELINLRLFKSALRRDFNIYLAESGQEGLEILSKEKIDLIITDQMMPKMNGTDFLREVKNKFPDVQIPKMILSGYSQSADVKKAIEEYDLKKFISKPWNVEELKSQINEAIGI